MRWGRQNGRVRHLSGRFSLGVVHESTSTSGGVGTGSVLGPVVNSESLRHEQARSREGYDNLSDIFVPDPSDLPYTFNSLPEEIKWRLSEKRENPPTFVNTLWPPLPAADLTPIRKSLLEEFESMRADNWRFESGPPK